MTQQNRPAIVLLSGGLDSATTLAIAKEEGFTCHALSFRYGQRHAVELAAAQRVANKSLALGDCERRGRIEPAAEEDNCGAILLRHQSSSLARRLCFSITFPRRYAEA